MTTSQPSTSQTAVQAPDPVVAWSTARRLFPIYMELAREFIIDTPECAVLEAQEETFSPESAEKAQQWLDEMDQRVQVHHLRQFLQTSSLVDPQGLVALLQHFLGKKNRTDAVRDKIDFLLVQFFSQRAPTDLPDDAADLAYVARSLEPVLGTVELKAPVWLKALDRVLDSARRCQSLDQLLHGGVLEQGRKAKAQAGELFYLPVALVAFARFGYLMRRVFFRLMLADLNEILEGLGELDEKGIEAIDCRRAQFSEQEPLMRLRMICQSWKVMFQAEYSSGQPLRMLVDLRASVDHALGRDKAASASSTAAASESAAVDAAKAGALKSAVPQSASPQPMENPKARAAVANTSVQEFEVAASTPQWKPDTNS